MVKWIIGFILLISFPAFGQVVTVADKINIRNDFAYDVLGIVDENILLYRDRGMEYFMHVYGEDLSLKRTKELTFEKKKVRVHYIIPRDTVFNITYSYKERDSIIYRINQYDKNAILVDSITIDKKRDEDIPRFLRYANSEDKSKTVLFAEEKGRIIHMKVIDNDLKTIQWETKVELKNIRAKDDFRKIIVTNEGIVIYMFERNNGRFSRDDHNITLLGFFQAAIVLQSTIQMEDRVTCDVDLAFNNITGNIVVAGLSSEKNVNAATHYFYINKHIAEYDELEIMEEVDIGVTFIKEVYGTKKKKEKELKDFRVYDLILRQDGGFILVTEMDREYMRRTGYNAASRVSRDYSSRFRGWTDHYNEDIAIFAVNPDGSEHWKEILYKKQFSQDDGGVYSSFFLFKTPSRLKIIYNDEIKNNNTVSEYILDPLGDYARNSLLSTDYQNLRLRFRDAIQISNHQLIVPSEKSYNLRLVKIDYSTL